MQKLYAKALDELVHQDGSDSKKLVTTLVAHLKASGRMRLLPSILREFKIREARRAKLAPSVEVATDAEKSEAIAAAAKEGIVVSKAVVNTALIKGWRARTGGTLVDHSAKRGLIDLYRKVTN